MSRAFSTGHHPLGTDLRMAVVADADDVAQEAFVRAFRGLATTTARHWWWRAAMARWSA